MATSKKQSTTRHQQASKAQAFDIIPRKQVKPSASARPVITPTSPVQSDNTLVQPATSAVDASQLTHQPLKLTPTGDVTAQDATVEVSAAASLGRRLAGTDDAGSDKASDRKAETTEIPTAPVVPAGADPDAIKANISKRAAATEKPTHDDMVPADEKDSKTDDAGEAEPVQLAEASKSDDPKPGDDDTAGDDAQEAEPADDKDDDVPANVLELEHDVPVDDALKNTGSRPAKHTEALKAELQSMSDDEAKDDADAADDEKDEHGRRHRELYGGKPVIVVHKHHGRSPAATIAWIIICLIVAVAIVDVLVDADVITTDYNIPHTNFL